MLASMGGMDIEQRYTSIEFNTVDPAKFTLPVEVKELAAQRKSAAASRPSGAAPSGDDADGKRGADGNADGDEDGR